MVTGYQWLFKTLLLPNFEPKLDHGTYQNSFLISVQATCGGSSNVNGTFFTSLGYPSTFDR